jgi:uncharacterized membrane protein YccC
MSTPSSTPNTLNRPHPLLAEWALTDGLAWIHIFKAALAAFLALWIAMRLDLPQPRTAMTTVFVVMQPQSGMVLAKSFYRFCGTLVGLVVMLALISLFSQQPVLFLTATALWVGICTAGAARNRNFRSYAFVLSGYTAALIGIPAAQHADAAFLTAMTRVAEVSLGILCSGAVSALVFPRHAGEQVRATVRKRFTSFVDYVSKALGGGIERSQIESINAAFVADVVGLEAARSVAVFEDPDTRMRSGRVARLNGEFMSVSTRFHALHQLMNRLRVNGAAPTVDALEPYFREVAPLLSAAGAPVEKAADAVYAAAQLDTFKAALPKRIRATRRALDPAIDLLEFDTAAELLYRFVDDLHAYTLTYASLAVPSHEREHRITRYVPKTSLLAAGVSGLRAFVVILVLSGFWILSAWPSGGTAVLDAAAVIALASSAPRPTQMAFQMAGGTALAAVAGMIVVFALYPHIDGFLLLSAVLLPFLMLGVFISTRPGMMGVGAGYCIFFCFLAGPDNVIQYDPSAFINDAIALVVSMLVCSMAFAVLLPTDAPWLRRLLMRELRRQVVTASKSSLTGLAMRFESGARDLLSQIDALAAGREDLQREALRWLFAVLEVGHAVIDLRTELSRSDNGSGTTARASGASIKQALHQVAHLFDHPSPRRFDAALSATTLAIDDLRAQLDTVHEPREERHRLQRMSSHLHFIRTALLDPQSPLGHFSQRELPHEGAPHAA